MGRAYIKHEDAVKYMKNGKMPVLSIGGDIGSIKVKLEGAMKFQTLKMYV